VAELVKATIFVSLFLWSFRQAQRPFQQIPTTIISKKRPKIINGDYLIPKLVVKNTGLVKIDFRASYINVVDINSSNTEKSCGQNAVVEPVVAELVEASKRPLMKKVL